MSRMNENTKRLVHRQLWLAALMVTVGLAIAGLSLARLHAQHQLEMAQATGTPGQPLQATPSPQPTNAPPAEAKPGGTRPTTPAPEPARPDPQAQKEGAKPALPPAPAEKMAPPIPEKK
jgi:outer membrane biosynthesis protein TonB